MKRWVIPIGRGGTVLIAIGLALALVSLIPAAQLGSFMGTEFVGPKRFNPLAGYGVLRERVFTPQQGLRIAITANGTLSVYLLEVSTQSIFEWINERHPEPTDLFNVTYFEEFLGANPELIHWQKENHNEKTEYEYVPTKTTNATVVLANPSSDLIRIEYEGSITGLVAPVGKVQTLARWTIPVGFMLTLPWLTSLFRTKARKGSQPLRS